MSISEDNVQLTDNHNETGGGTGTRDKRKRQTKEIAPRSSVWSHFTRLVDDRNRCKCNYCTVVLKCDPSKVGTSSLKKHNQKCKGYLKHLESKDQTVLSNSVDCNAEKLGITRFSQKEIQKATVIMIIMDELPFAFVENEGFKYFCSKACPTYITPSRRTIARDISNFYMEEKANLKNVLSGQIVCLTTDLWTSITTDSYMVITAHFIDMNWRLNRKIIGFNTVSDHTAETISKQLETCLLDWEIKKVFTITADNAYNNDKAVKIFREALKSWGNDALVLDGEFMHVRCGAHILNLIVNNGLKEMNESVISIRNAVKYVRSSSSRLKAFQQRVAEDKVGRGSVVLDCGTRWNATYLMLSSALKFKPTFERMLVEDKLYDSYFIADENGNKRVGPPVAHDWENARRLVKFLKNFYDSTLTFSSSTKVTASSCYEEICTIEDSLTTLINNEDPLLSNMACEMKKKFDKYWGGLEKINKLLICASVLDPRSKMSFATYCFEMLYGSDTSKCLEMKENLTRLLHRLFGWYSERYNTNAMIGSSGGGGSDATSGCESANVDTNMFEFEDIIEENARKESIFSRYSKMMVDNRDVAEVSNELEIYLMEKVDLTTHNSLGMQFDILSWWRVNAHKFPILSRMARDLLAIPVSTVASKSIFSTGDHILDQYRSCLQPDMVETLILSQDWLRGSFRYEEQGTFQKLVDTIEITDSLLEEIRKYATMATNEQA